MVNLPQYCQYTVSMHTLINLDAKKKNLNQLGSSDSDPKQAVLDLQPDHGAVGAPTPSACLIRRCFRAVKTCSGFCIVPVPLFLLDGALSE